MQTAFEQRSSMHVRHVKTLVDHMSKLFVSEPGWEDLTIADAACGLHAVTTEWISEISPEDCFGHTVPCSGCTTLCECDSG
jgi:hypothetical protein